MKHDYLPEVIEYLQLLYTKSNKYNLKTKFIYKKIIDQLKNKPKPIFDVADLNIKFLGQKTKKLIQENVLLEKNNKVCMKSIEKEDKCNGNSRDECYDMDNDRNYELDGSTKKDNETNIKDSGMSDSINCCAFQNISVQKINDVKNYSSKKTTNDKENSQKLDKIEKEAQNIMKITNKITDEIVTDNELCASNKNKHRKYIPKYMSGAFAILKSLYKCDGLSKRQICSKSNKYSKFEFNLSERFSAWNSIKTLIKKDLVFIEDKKYYLTETGKETCKALNFDNMQKDSAKNNLNMNDNMLNQEYTKVTEKVKDKNKNKENENKENKNKENENKENENKENENKENENAYTEITKNDSLSINTVDLSANCENKINLIIDSREIKSKKDRSYFQRNLDGVTQNLELGDFLWTKNDNVLNYIIERKKGTDFISSIGDGRFNEQKKRLFESGVTNIFYIVENLKEKDCKEYVEGKKIGCKDIGYNFVNSCLLATKNEGLVVLETNNIKETVQVIKMIDTFIREEDIEYNKKIAENTHNITETGAKNVENTCQFAMSYDEFAEKGKKTNNITNSDILYRMLLSVSGVSHKKADFLTKKYETLSNLVEEAKSKDFAAKISQIEIDGSKFGNKLIYKILDMIL